MGGSLEKRLFQQVPVRMVEPTLDSRLQISGYLLVNIGGVVMLSIENAMTFVKFYGSEKRPISALGIIPRPCSVTISTPHSSKLASLISALFTKPSEMRRCAGDQITYLPQAAFSTGPDSTPIGGRLHACRCQW
jgi:hypothetical protein